ncbi:MAG: hypothetical protein ACOC89_04685 [Candidatus Saliniplasma sp.]
MSNKQWRQREVGVVFDLKAKGLNSNLGGKAGRVEERVEEKAAKEETEKGLKERNLTITVFVQIVEKKYLIKEEYHAFNRHVHRAVQR